MHRRVEGIWGRGRYYVYEDADGQVTFDGWRVWGNCVKDSEELRSGTYGKRKGSAVDQKRVAEGAERGQEERSWSTRPGTEAPAVAEGGEECDGIGEGTCAAGQMLTLTPNARSFVKLNWVRAQPAGAVGWGVRRLANVQGGQRGETIVGASQLLLACIASLRHKPPSEPRLGLAYWARGTASQQGSRWCPQDVGLACTKVWGTNTAGCLCLAR